MSTEAANVETSKWYVLRVVSGKEKKVKEYLDKEITRSGWDKIVKQVFLPVEKVYKVANGKKVVRERNFYPGYVMIEVEGGIWSNGRHTRGKGYLGDMEKYNAATMMGFQVLRFSTEQVTSGFAINQIEGLVKG